MKKSEIDKQATAVIRDIFHNLDTKEKYKKAISDITDIILPGKIGAEKFIWQRVQSRLITKFWKLFIKK